MNLLTKITWPQYLLGVVCILVFYYVYVALRYYVFDLKVLLSRSRKSRPGGVHPPEEEDDDYEPLNESAMYNSPDESIKQIESLISEIKSCIARAAATNLSKGEVQHALKEIISRYSDLKNTPYQDAIIELILSECDKHEITTLDEDDCRELWVV